MRNYRALLIGGIVFHSPVCADNEDADFNINPLITPILVEKPIGPVDFNKQQNNFFKLLPKRIYVEDEPEQHYVSDFLWINKDKYQLGLTDKIFIRGMVLSTRQYTDDNRSDISPLDVVVGWKKMSDPSVISKIYIKQSERFYLWKVDEFPIPRDEIERFSTNLHIVPDNELLKKKLSGLKAGDIVSLEGYLVDVKDDENQVWITSRVRDDSGDGACEILLLKNFSIIDRLIP